MVQRKTSFKYISHVIYSTHDIYLTLVVQCWYNIISEGAVLYSRGFFKDEQITREYRLCPKLWTYPQVWLQNNMLLVYRVRVMVFNTTYNNITAISWQSVLLMKETRVPGENHRPVSSLDSITLQGRIQDFKLGVST